MPRAKLPPAGATKRVVFPGGVGLDLVWCPPGKFMMGKGDVKHEVTLAKGFWIGKYEVTQAQWKSVMDYNPSSSKGDNLPVESDGKWPIALSLLENLLRF